MEDRFMKEKWLRLSKAINFAIALFAFVFLVDGLGMYQTLGGFHWALIPFPIFIGGLLLFFRLSDQWKSSNFDAFFAGFLVSYHLFQMFLMYSFPEQLAESGMDPKNLLSQLPTLLIFIFILNFI